MLKGKTGKLDLCSKVCISLGYPKGTRGGLFYSTQDNKVFVSTNAVFLEHNYMTNFKHISKIVMEELFADEICPIPKVVVEQERKETSDQDQSLPPP